MRRTGIAPGPSPLPSAALRVMGRPPTFVVALIGATVASCYAHFALAMRWGPPLVMFALGALTLVLCAAALWRVVLPLAGGGDGIPTITQTRAPFRMRELEREKLAVLKAIKEVDLDHQMQKIADGDHRTLTERYRARALRIMSELAVGDDYRALIERELKDRLAVARATATPSIAGGSGEAA